MNGEIASGFQGFVVEVDDGVEIEGGLTNIRLWIDNIHPSINP